MPLTLAAGKTTVITVEQLERADDLRSRPDLALSAADVRAEGDELVVTVHNVGAAPTPAGIGVEAWDGEGRVVARAELPAIEAPADCLPRTATVRLEAAGASRVVLDPGGRLPEITEVNNLLDLPD